MLGAYYLNHGGAFAFAAPGTAECPFIGVGKFLSSEPGSGSLTSATYLGCLGLLDWLLVGRSSHFSGLLDHSR